MPQTQRPKTIPLPKGIELQQAGYNYRDNANLLANMELGVHREDYERTTADQDKDSESTPGAPVGVALLSIMYCLQQWQHSG